MDNAAIVIADPAGVIAYWSPGAEAAFGWSAGHAVGQTLDLLVPEEFRPAHWQGFHRAVASGTAAAEGDLGDFPARRADGEVAPIQGRLTLVRAAQGQVIAAMVVFG